LDRDALKQWSSYSRIRRVRRENQSLVSSTRRRREKRKNGKGQSRRLRAGEEGKKRFINMITREKKRKVLAEKYSEEGVERRNSKEG